MDNGLGKVGYRDWLIHWLENINVRHEYKTYQTGKRNQRDRPEPSVNRLIEGQVFFLAHIVN